MNQPATITNTIRGLRLPYETAAKQVCWNSVVRLNAMRVITYIVRINAGVPVGTVLTNNVINADGSLGGTASASMVIK